MDSANISQQMNKNENEKQNKRDLKAETTQISTF